MDSLGYIAHHTGQQAAALDYYRQAIAVYREHGDTWQVVVTLDYLGQTYATVGDHEQARASGGRCWSCIKLSKAGAPPTSNESNTNSTNSTTPDDVTRSHNDQL